MEVVILLYINKAWEYYATIHCPMNEAFLESESLESPAILECCKDFRGLEAVSCHRIHISNLAVVIFSYLVSACMPVHP